MPPNSKKGKKKSRSKQHIKKSPTQGLNGAPLEAQLYDEDGEYPTSRVIKRAPNGDVIVESLPEENGKRRGSIEHVKSNTMRETQPISVTLDSHWETLTSEEKKDILRIKKSDIFEVLRDYQMTQSCTCSVCGRRHMSMEIEMERIYETLYEMDREKDPGLNPIKFHLSMIKELQTFKMQRTSQGVEGANPKNENNNLDLDNPSNEFENMRDEVVKYFLSSDAVDTLKEEVMNFKQHKQQQLHHDRSRYSGDEVEAEADMIANSSINSSSQFQGEDASADLASAEPILLSEIPDANDHENINSISSNDHEKNNTSKEDLQERYLKFAKTFVSSHPKIAEEYVNRMMMYPDMRALTDDLMNNNGQAFVKAIEDFVINKEQSETKESFKEKSIFKDFQYELDLNRIQHRDETQGYTTIRHDGKELNAEEYDKLQHTIANSIVDSYDKSTDRFSEISPIEKELFTRFIYGEDKKRFRHILSQTYNERIVKSEPHIETSLAAAAATTASPGMISSRNGSTIAYNHEFNHADVLGSKDFDETYDEYSDYEHEEDELDDDDEEEDDEDYEEEDEEDLKSELVEQEGECLEYDRQERCVHEFHNSESYHNHNKESIATDLYHNSQFGHGNELEDEYEEEEYDNEDQYDSGMDEAGRIEEGRKLIQISITKLLQGRIMDSYHEKQAETNRLKLLQELEAEEQKKKAKEEKKQKKKEKEKEKKKAQQLAKEEENRRKEQEAKQIKKEAEERERQRREAQRKKVEEAKRKKDEEKKRKLEDQRRREEEQERQRKLKEEQKRKRDEEKRIKENEKRKREEDRILREQQKEKQERLKKIAEEEKMNEVQRRRMNERAIFKQNEGEILPPSSSPHISNISPNTPYGSVRQSVPHTNSQNVNDDIIDIINSASASRPRESSPSHLNVLLQPNNHMRTNDHSSQAIMGDTTHFFNSPAMLQPNFGSNSIAFDPLSRLPPSSPAVQDADFSMKQQSFGLPSWRSFANNPSTTIGQQHGQHELQHELQHEHNQDQAKPLLHENGSSSFDLNGAEASNEHFLDNEIDNLAKILKSAGINETSVNNESVAEGSLLWDDQMRSMNVPAPENGGPMNRNGNHLPGIDITSLDNSNPRAVASSSHHSSIWGTLNNGPGISGQGEVSSLSNGIGRASSAYSSSNIWGNSISNGMSFLNGANEAANLNAHQAPNSLKVGDHVPPSNATENDEFQESIYRAYLAFASLQTSQYVPTDLLHHNGPCHSLDYSTFITYLMRMRISYGCELLSDSSGVITHARMSGTNQGANSNSRTTANSHESLLNDLYGNNAHYQRGAQHAMPDANTSLDSNTQMFSAGQPLNLPSTLTSNFWG